MNRLTHKLLILTGALCTLSLYSLESPLSSMARARPDPKGLPTIVRVGAFLNNLTTFNEADETFGVDCIVIFSWKDPRLTDPKHKTGRDLSLDSVWHPDLMWLNRRAIEQVHPRTVRVDPEGGVRYVQRVLGTMSIPIKLNDFPLDVQALYIEIASRTYGPQDVSFQPDPAEIGQSRGQGIMTGWHTSVVRLMPVTENLMSTQGWQMDQLSGFKIEIQARRDWKYYALREILPLVFIVLMASALFWLPVTEHGMKIGIATGAIFSLMAYYVQLGRNLPRVSYLTRMDYFLVGATVLVFFSFSFVISGMYMVKRGQETKVIHIERWARAGFPGLLLIVLLASFGTW